MASPPSLVRALDRCAALTRTRVLAQADAVSLIPSVARDALRVPPGTRAVVVAGGASASKRALVVPHHLRRAGYLPVLCELPDASPLAENVAAAVEMAKRTGAGLILAYGGAAAMSVGRAAALVAANGGKVKDYAAAVGGKGSPHAASLPFIAVPSCPAGGLEVARESTLLFEGQNVGVLRPHPASLQAAVVDFSLAAASLHGDPALRTGYATLVHAIEAYTRTDSDAATRHLSWAAVQAAARGLGRLFGAAPKPAGKEDNLRARADLASASALVGAAMTSGPLGPCRGIALSVASRYRIRYSDAVSALAPEVLSGLAEFLGDRLEEIEEAEAGGARPVGAAAGDGGGGGGMEWRDTFEEDEDVVMRRRRQWTEGGKGATAMFSSGRRAGAAAGQRRGRGTARADDKGEAAAEGIDGARLDADLAEYARHAEGTIGGGCSGSSRDDSEVNEEDPASDVIVGARRLRHVVFALREGLAAGAAASSSSSSPPVIDYGTLPPSSALADCPLSALGDLLRDYQKLGATLVPAVDATSVPSLADYALSDADVRSVADAAEVDDNTLAHLVQLKNRDIVEMLRRS
jgi:alcohol dehydrogenase class IV